MQAMIAVGAAAAIPPMPADAAKAAGKNAASAGRRIIDVHHHMFPPALMEVLRDVLPPPAKLADAGQSLAEINAGGVEAAMISYPTSDIVSLPEQRLTQLIRKANDQAMATISNGFGRYGLFASLPLPYVDASLREIGHIFDELHADGVMLITNYGKRWLGDPTLAPILDELNRRKAVVYTHPNAADCCKGLIPGVGDWLVEYETDTARTIASLLFSGTAERCQAIRFIFSHAGGTMPALIERFTTAVKLSPALAQKIPQGALKYLQSFHYDTAQSANPSALGALLKFVPDRQVMFGTDFPYRGTLEQVAAIQALHLGRAATDGILSGNARRLLQRFRS
jgi:predicted TIM-barrel fold metal-dependent hydrolase